MASILPAQRDQQRKEELLRGYIEKYLKMSHAINTKKELAARLRMTDRTLSTRLSKPETFTLKELRLLFKVLAFPAEDRSAAFID